MVLVFSICVVVILWLLAMLFVVIIGIWMLLAIWGIKDKLLVSVFFVGCRNEIW